MKKLKYALPLMAAVGLIIGGASAASASTGTTHQGTVHGTKPGGNPSPTGDTPAPKPVPYSAGYCAPTQIYFAATGTHTFAARVHPDAKFETCKLTVALYDVPDTWDGNGFDASAVPQTRVKYVHVTVTKEPTNFGIDLPACGNHQIDVVSNEQPYKLGGEGSPAHLYYGVLFKGATEGCGDTPPPTPAQHSVTASCTLGVDTELSHYPRGSTVEIDLGTASHIRKFHGTFSEKDVTFDRTKALVWKVIVTTKSGVGSFTASGTVGPCTSVVHPKPPVIECRKGQVKNSKGVCYTPKPVVYHATPLKPVITPAVTCDSDNKTATTKDDCLAFTGATPFTKYAAMGGFGLPLIGGLLYYVARKRDDEITV